MGLFRSRCSCCCPAVVPLLLLSRCGSVVAQLVELCVRVRVRVVFVLVFRLFCSCSSVLFVHWQPVRVKSFPLFVAWAPFRCARATPPGLCEGRSAASTRRGGQRWGTNLMLAVAVGSTVSSIARTRGRPLSSCARRSIQLHCSSRDISRQCQEWSAWCGKPPRPHRGTWAITIASKTCSCTA